MIIQAISDETLILNLKNEWSKIGSELANEKIATLNAAITLINLRDINFSIKKEKNKFIIHGSKKDIEILKKELNAINFLKESEESIC